MRLLDTDVLIDYQRGHAPSREWFAQLDETPSVPGFVMMELIQGARNSRHIREAQQLIDALPVVWPSENVCNRALTNFVTPHLSHGLGLIDCLNAACAVQRSAELCTFNRKHFRAVPDLVFVQPYRR